MRFLLTLALLALPLDKAITISATDTGISASDLADTPTSSAVNMEAGYVCNQLSLTVAVTPGTTTRIDVKCFESQDGTNYDQLSICDTANPSACTPDTRRYTLSDWTAVSGVYYIASRWHVTKKYAKCSIDDPDDGTGTVTVTGTRSWQ